MICLIVGNSLCLLRGLPVKQVVVMRVAIKPELVRWARRRAGGRQDDLVPKFGKLPEWESGATQPTLKQVERFAKAVHVPVGYLFLDEPPDEVVPIPDFRTFGGQKVTRPSPNLLDTIYACQERQSWYKDFVRTDRQPALGFIGSATMESRKEEVAEQIRKTLGFSTEARRSCGTWSEALRELIRQTENIGVLVMVSGIVGSNTRRKLEPEEFRGFVLSDPHAPLIFINGADTKAAQMFTLAHELAHLWLGNSALSNVEATPATGCRDEEVWCNAVAAEMLVPMSVLRDELRQDEPLDNAKSRLARFFKVSTLVILRRLKDARWLGDDDFAVAWEQEKEYLKNRGADKDGGGNFYNTTLSRTGRQFAHALIVSTLEGQTLYRDAFRMFGISKTETFNNLGRELGVIA